MLRFLQTSSKAEKAVADAKSACRTVLQYAYDAVHLRCTVPDTVWLSTFHLKSRNREAGLICSESTVHTANVAGYVARIVDLSQWTEKHN